MEGFPRPLCPLSLSLSSPELRPIRPPFLTIYTYVLHDARVVRTRNLAQPLASRRVRATSHNGESKSTGMLAILVGATGLKHEAQLIQNGEGIGSISGPFQTSSEEFCMPTSQWTAASTVRTSVAQLASLHDGIKEVKPARLAAKVNSQSRTDNRRKL